MPEPDAIDLRHAAVFDTSQIKADKPEVGILPPLPKIGYRLSLFLLGIISIFLLFLIFYMLFAKTDAASQINLSAQNNTTDTTAFKQKLSMIKILQDEHKASRDFVLQITQMVLLNLLLPVLTAILGYIFGSHYDAKNS